MVKRTSPKEDTKSSLSGSSCTSADLSRCPMGVDAEYKEFSPRILKPLKNRREYGHSASNYRLECGDVGDLRDGDELKSMELESNGSKVTVDDGDFMHLDSKESMVTSLSDRKPCCEGFAESEAVGLSGDKNPRSCLKRILIEIDEDDSETDSKKKRTINEVMSKDNELRSVVVESGGITCNGENDVILVDPEVSKEEESSSVMNGGPLWEMVRSLNLIAKDPCDPTVVPLPEKTKWKNYSNENMWKRVLLAREALLLKRHDASGKQPVLQNNQRMHPSMYEDNSGSGYKLRERLQYKQGLTTGARHPQSCSESFSSESRNNPSNLSTADSLFDDHEEDETPLGPEFQAVVPVWTEVASESDCKWLGTPMWPIRRSRGSITLIERDPIGKGRQDSCGCQFRGSAECVRFHIGEKRKKLKLELGAAFNLFKFDKMGEDVEIFWKKEEQTKFAAIVRSNPLSQDKCFWVEMVKLFPTRTREELVSYYFNVFLLQRRALQNRISPSNIDSDDDESESQFPAVANATNDVKPSTSIFYSPTKSHSKHK